MRLINRRPARLATLVVALTAVSLSLPASVGAVEAGARAGAGAGVTTGVVPAVAGDEITFIGHGWGHGRGMGQYGALGYAVDHAWNYRQILQHFYSNTTVGNVGGQMIDVELITQSSRTWTIVAGNNLRVNGADVGGAGLDVALVERSGSTFTVRLGTGCESAFGGVVGTYSGSVELTVPTQSGYENLIRTCETGNTMRAYRGSMVVAQYPSSAAALVMNRVSLEEYLLGVVPRESPDSWGSLGSGRGMEALKAQAVAARSYAMSSSRASGAKTCDTTSCQVYGGAAELVWNGSGYVVNKSLDGANTNAAVAQTGGEVRLMAGGAVARTEFSSSTGGYTVAGTFPAVQDDGDDISLNPNHTWTATFTPAQIAAKLGLNGVRDIQVTSRNGLGDWGGRVLEVRVVDGSGVAHLFSGGAFRTAMGTGTFKSDWFSFSWLSPVVAQAIVRALYQDLLGRAPDPTGLTGWSNLLLSGTSQSALVSSLTSSDEYIARRVRQAYVEVLGREPDPVGAAGWLAAIRERRATVDDVQRVFYDSVEYYAISGGTPEGYVARLYTTMLGRPASAGEITTWVGLFNSRGRAWVVDNIWWSAEAAERRAGVYYRTFLGREPDLPGVQAWGRVLLAQGEGAVRAGIAGSQEYRDKAIARFP